MTGDRIASSGRTVLGGRITRAGRSAAGTAVLGAAVLALPLAGNSYHLHMACMIGINVISATGLNLLTGYAGMVSLGHAAFMGVGAYGVAWFGAHLGLPFYLCLPLGGLLAAAVGMIAGLPSLRLKGLYLAMATLAAQFILTFVFNEWEPVTGGRGGTPVAPARIGGLTLTTERELYLLIAPLTVGALLVARNLFRTRVGRAFIALRDREIAASVLGVDPRRYKLTAFGVSSFYAGVAGGLMAYFFRVVTPGQFGFDLSLFFLAAIVAGGMGTVTGGVLGALFITLSPELFAWVTGAFGPRVAGLLSPAREVLFGLLIVGFLTFEPQGMTGIGRRMRNLLARMASTKPHTGGGVAG